MRNSVQHQRNKSGVIFNQNKLTQNQSRPFTQGHQRVPYSAKENLEIISNEENVVMSTQSDQFYLNDLKDIISQK